MLSIEAWVKALAAIVLLAGIAELLLPSGTFKGYARAFLGLIVLIGVLQPVVGLLHGDLRLDLPGWPVAASTETQAATDQAQVSDAAATSYESLVAAAAARIARQVPGVSEASATVQFGAAGADGLPAVAGAQVSIRASPPGAAQGAALPAAVRQAVAAGLAVDPGQVEVASG